MDKKRTATQNKLAILNELKEYQYLACFGKINKQRIAMLNKFAIIEGLQEYADSEMDRKAAILTSREESFPLPNRKIRKISRRSIVQMSAAKATCSCFPSPRFPFPTLGDFLAPAEFGSFVSRKSAPLPQPRISYRSTTLFSTRKATRSNMPSQKFVQAKKTGCFSSKKGGALMFDRSGIKAFRPPVTPRKTTKERLLRGSDTNPESLDLNLKTCLDSWVAWDESAKAKPKITSAMVSTDRRHYRSLPLPYISTPKEVGVFSEMDSGRTQKFDLRELKAFRPPAAPTKITTEHLLRGNDTNLESLDLNLKAGLDSWVACDENVKEHDHRLFNWILHNREQLRSKSFPRPSLQQCCENAEFVCSEDLLVELALTPYSSTEWVVNVVRWQDVFFLATVHSSEHNKKGLFMMEKFVNLVTCDVGFETDPWTDPGDALDSRARFSAVFRTDISSTSAAGHRLLYTGGIDCVDGNGQYLAANVSSVINTDKRLFEFYRYKMLSLGLSCLFMGVDRLVVGFHDSSNKLVHIGEFDFNSIPKQAESVLGKAAWMPTVCMNFLDSFLSDLKQRIPENDINAAYQIRFMPPFQHGARVKSPGLQFERLIDVEEGGTGLDYLQSPSRFRRCFRK